MKSRQEKRGLLPARENAKGFPTMHDHYSKYAVRSSIRTEFGRVTISGIVFIYFRSWSCQTSAIFCPASNLHMRPVISKLTLSYSWTGWPKGAFKFQPQSTDVSHWNYFYTVLAQFPKVEGSLEFLSEFGHSQYVHERIEEGVWVPEPDKSHVQLAIAIDHVFSWIYQEKNQQGKPRSQREERYARLSFG